MPAATLEELETLVGAPPTPPPQKPGAGRLASLDAFRGFIMIVLAANGFGWRHLAKNPDFSWIAAQFEHVPWTGLVFWDLIQPAFMFMVGVAMPFSVARRQAEGATNSQLLRHVAWRSLMLIVLSNVLMSVSAGRLHFQLINVLSQIAFTYLLSFLLLLLPFRWQVAGAAGILGLHSLLFYLYPGSTGAFSQADNVGARIDQFFHLKYNGFYVTINFLTETGTTLFGVWTGLLLRRHDSHRRRLQVLFGAALTCFAAGYALTPLVPMVKRIWTASFTLFSTGWVLLILLAFYYLVDVRGWRRPAFPLIVVGMNSIFIYSISIVLAGWLDRAVAVFTFRWQFIGTLAPVAQATTVVLVMWYLCYWLYQRKIFFKL